MTTEVQTAKVHSTVARAMPDWISVLAMISIGGAYGFLNWWAMILIAFMHPIGIVLLPVVVSPAVVFLWVAFRYATYSAALLAPVIFWFSAWAAKILRLYQSGYSMDWVTTDHIAAIETMLILACTFGSIIWCLLWTAVARFSQQRESTSTSCVSCGYDLRHLPHSRCPECGTFNPDERSPSGRG